MPNIGIACESAIYIYKNYKPYFKFVLPFVEMPSSEINILSKY